MYLIEYLRKFQILSEMEINDFADRVIPVTMDKNDHFIKEGEVCTKAAFLVSGIFRSYYVTDSGEEFTYCFTFPQTLVTAYSSYLTSLPTVENIQAVTAVEMLVISVEELKQIEKKSPNWVHIFKAIAEQQYLELEKRVFQLQSNDALKRYRYLIENNSEYIQKIPLLYLASYLGISQRHLSRIRKEISF